MCIQYTANVCEIYTNGTFIWYGVCIVFLKGNYATNFIKVVKNGDLTGNDTKKMEILKVLMFLFCSCHTNTTTNYV